MKKRRLLAALSRITPAIHRWPRRPCVLWDKRLIIPLIPAMVSGRPPYFDQPRLNGTLQPPSPSPEVKTPPNVRAHLNTHTPRAPRRPPVGDARGPGGGRAGGAGAGRRCRAHRLLRGATRRRPGGRFYVWGGALRRLARGLLHGPRFIYGGHGDGPGRDPPRGGAR